MGSSTERLKVRQSWLEGAAEQMEKRLQDNREEHKARMEFLEGLYGSIDKKFLWIVALMIGVLVTGIGILIRLLYLAPPGGG